MLTSIGEFARYFEGVRRRTWAAVDRVTPEILEWRPWPQALSCGEIVRHLAGAERFFVTKVVEDRWTDALDPGPNLDLAATRALLGAAHEEQAPRLLAVPDRRLRERVKDLAGGDVSVWRLLMAMAEHEIHHRSQLNSRLSAAGIGAPQLFGYRMEEVIARARAEPRGQRGSNGCLPA
jgi:uncharacterized damage-inducible protein DinB